MRIQTQVVVGEDDHQHCEAANDVQWLKALVDPSSRDVFAFQAQIVPQNWTATP